MSKRQKKECGEGEIMRKGFHRKGFQRRSFKRKDGTVVSPSYIPGAYVSPTCTKDMGKPGKGPKTLPRPDDLVHLTKYGYSIRQSETNRRAALREASRKNGTLLVLQRLNLLRNYQPVPENKEIFTDDVEFMKEMYAKEKAKRQRKQSGSKNSSQRKSKNQRGGVYLFGEPSDGDGVDTTSETSDEVVDVINLPEENLIEINTVVDREKICDADGKCGVRNKIYESHRIDDRDIEYYTLEEKDVRDLLEFDTKFLDPNATTESTLLKIKNNPGLLIGIKVDGILKGYCQYDLATLKRGSESLGEDLAMLKRGSEPLGEDLATLKRGSDPGGNRKVQIKCFNANKGYRTALHDFLERYFQSMGYEEIKIDLDMQNKSTKDNLNFLNQKGGFIINELIPMDNKIVLQKYI